MGETIRMRTSEAEGPAYRSGLVAALDIGSSKIVCLIGRAEPAQLRVVGVGPRESRGIRAATITSLEHAIESIREAKEAAENLADLKVHSVLISVNCGAPRSVSGRAAMTLDGTLVSDAHLLDLLGEGRAECHADGAEIIQCAPVSYVVDEARGVRDPSGMFCQRIGVQMHGVAVKPSPLQNLKLAVEHCRLTVAGTLFAGYASGLAVLTPDEMQLGATLIDMGGGVTSIAVFLEGALVHADVVPMGGLNVTVDLAKVLGAPLSAAERIKALYGAALGDIETGTDVVAVPQTGESGDDAAMRVPRSMLTRIIQPRLEEIFGHVQTQLRESGYDVAAGRRAVLTGGASQLAGARELAQRVLNKNVRIGRPQGLPGLPAASAGPDYATAIGLLMAGATMPPEMINPELAPSQPVRRGLFSRLTGGLLG
ncbi:MAG TPA: cell division protein FtsA [Rhizomicrobium sp.]|jgi:cell division protein FtsA|nr:cell division protein FtsA [Rhizomicrobium sp.]